MLWLLLAASAPTYLACTLDQDGKALPVEVAVAEDAQQAIISLPSGRVVTRQALISPTMVKVPDEQMVWSIDRVSLAFDRTITIGGAVSTERGKCELKPAPAKRAF